MHLIGSHPINGQRKAEAADENSRAKTTKGGKLDLFVALLFEVGDAPCLVLQHEISLQIKPKSKHIQFRHQIDRD